MTRMMVQQWYIPISLVIFIAMLSKTGNSFGMCQVYLSINASINEILERDYPTFFNNHPYSLFSRVYIVGAGKMTARDIAIAQEVQPNALIVCVRTKLDVAAAAVLKSKPTFNMREATYFAYEQIHQDMRAQLYGNGLERCNAYVVTCKGILDRKWLGDEQNLMEEFTDQELEL